MAIYTVVFDDRADFICQFAEIVIGRTMAIGTIAGIFRQRFFSVAMHAVAGGAFYFAAYIAFAARKQLYLVAVYINSGHVAISMKVLSRGVIGQCVAGLKAKGGFRHYIGVTRMALRAKINPPLPV